MTDWSKFWEDVHHGVLPDFWLTNTPPEDYIAGFRMAGVLTPGLRVLEIGPGTGLMVKYLLELGCEVGACDISHTGLLKLPDEVTRIHVDDLRYERDGAYDLGISYLTFQHVDDAMLTYIVQNAVRVCGELRFQMAYLTDPALEMTGYTATHRQEGPLYFRSLQELAEMCPGVAFKELLRKEFTAQNITWTYVRALEEA